MTIERIRTHSEETRTEAIRLRANGMPIRKIAAVLCVPYQSVRYWCEKQAPQIERPVRVKTKSGSGMIAPPAYRYGYRWHGGRVQGW